MEHVCVSKMNGFSWNTARRRGNVIDREYRRNRYLVEPGNRSHASRIQRTARPSLGRSSNGTENVVCPLQVFAISTTEHIEDVAELIDNESRRSQLSFNSENKIARRPAFSPPFLNSAIGGRLSSACAGAMLGLAMWGLPLDANFVTTSAYAKTDSAEVGACVLSKCPAQLAKCLTDPLCVENLLCIQSCTGRDDETACQIRCGDKYDDAAVDVFNSCAVSNQKCVPQRVDEGLYPIPPDSALDQKFDLSAFQGRWYITAGLNPLFDQFPCQEHYFAQPPEAPKDTVYAQINWRIPLTEDDFIQRSTMQRFVQQKENPAILLNHDNEYLHYQDDWYILASKPDNYVFVYYRGENDAWKGYGGATVYTRAASLPQSLIPELREAASRAGLNWDDFKITDNSCPPKPTRKSPFDEVEKDFVIAERFAAKEVTELEKDFEKAEELAARNVAQIEKYLEPKLKSFGKGFTVLTEEVEVAAESLEKEAEKEADAARRLIQRFQMEASMGIFGKLVQNLPLSVREFIMPMP